MNKLLNRLKRSKTKDKERNEIESIPEDQLDLFCEQLEEENRRLFAQLQEIRQKRVQQLLENQAMQEVLTSNLSNL